MKLWSRRSRVSRAGADRSRRDRGAALIEFALVAPIFFFVVFSGIEVGLMARSFLSLQDAGRTAARTAAVERSDVNADLAIAEVIDARLSSLTGELQRVVVYNAASLSSVIDDVNMGLCVDATFSSTPGQCTVYSSAALDSLIDAGPLTADSAPTGGGYLPSQRSEGNFIGIYVEYDHRSVTGFFDTMTMRSDTVQVIEADLGG